MQSGRPDFNGQGKRHGNRLLLGAKHDDGLKYSLPDLFLVRRKTRFEFGVSGDSKTHGT
jgi:hypothetical protein